MQKKMIAIIGVIVVLFIALFLINNYKTKQTVEENENPYEKEKLKQSTIAQLDDPLYQNQVTPDELEKILSKDEEVTVYFYSPECGHCLNTTPILIPLAEDLNVDIKKLNLLEFEEEWDTYVIEGTPTLIHFKNGEEVGRISGYHEEADFKQFFEEYNVIDENK